MNNERIQALIAEGKVIERQTGMLRQTVINLANGNGRRVTELEVQKVINFVSEYIEHAPALMTLIEDATANYDEQENVRPILDATEEYFLAAEDIIPDRLGLVGLLDDAYLTHSLMQAISDRVKSHTGKSLLPMEPHADNAFIRRLIGEPFASILDERVAATLAGPSLQENIHKITIVLSQLNLASGPDPIWGYAQVSGISDARIHALGVF